MISRRWYGGMLVVVDPPRAAGKLVQKVQGHSELLGAIRYFVCSVKGTGLDIWFCFF